MNKIKDFLKNKRKSVILCIITILIVISGISSYFILKNNNSNSDFIIGKIEEVKEELSNLAKGENGEYFLSKANANIKFKVKTEESELKYKVIDEDEKEVETTVNKVEEYYEIIKPENYEAGKSYKIVLENATFIDEKLANIKTLGFTIVRPNANTQVLKKEVKKANVETITNIEEKENDFTLTSTKEYQKGDIIYYSNENDIKVFKVDTISKENDNYIINTTTPQLEEIYKELDIYGEFNNNITDFIPNKELEEYIKVSLVKSGILEDLINSLGTTVYAASEELIQVNIEPQRDGSLKATISITLIGGNNSFISLDKMKNHEITFEMEMILKLKTHHEINFTKIDVGANVDIEVTKALSIKPKEEYWEEFNEEENKNDITSIAKTKELLKALKEDTAEGEQHLGEGRIPTPIPGITVNIGVSLVENLKMAFQLSASETTTVKTNFGFKDGINKVNKVGFYWNSDVSTTDKSFKALGKAELRIGIMPIVEINFIEAIKVGASISVGGYGEGQINYSISKEGEEDKLDGKLSYGIFLEGKIYARAIGINKPELTIYENKFELASVNRDILEEERKAKEEAEKKALEEALANVLNGDFSYFAGNYTCTSYGQSFTVTIDKNGIFKNGIGNASMSGGGYFENGGKPKSIRKKENGIIELTYSYYWPGEAWISKGSHEITYDFIPIGVEYIYEDWEDYSNGEFKKKRTDTSKVRIIDTFIDGGPEEIYYKN